MKELDQFGIIPVDFSVLADVFSEYRHPEDKLSSLENKGDLIRLKKGMYVVNGNKPFSKELIANHLYGPSYVSLETALSFYKLIPERVYETRSVTIKRSKTFTTPLGVFSYNSVPDVYYPLGLVNRIIEDKYSYLIASPEKALSDYLLLTTNIRIQSVKAMRIFLEEDLRIDLSALSHFNPDIILSCVTMGRKKGELFNLYKLIQSIQN
jgi:hypothetical protein